MRRRTFIGALFSGLAVSTLGARVPKLKAGDLPTRALGKTGERLTRIGMGGARFHLIPFEEGKALVQRAYDLGINYFDMARSYWDGRAEEVYGAVLPAFRKNVFITTKTTERSSKKATEELELSLKRLKTDYVDLWQIHGVGEKEEVAEIVGPGGALEAFVSAKKAGKCRFIGFTGHHDPNVHLQMLQAYDKFDTILMPLHVADPAYLSFEKITLPKTRESGIGVLGMKIFGNAYLLRAFSARDCLSYVLSLPVHSVTLGFSTMGQLEDNIRIAQQFKPLSPEEMTALRARGESIKGPALEYWKRKVEPSAG